MKKCRNANYLILKQSKVYATVKKTFLFLSDFTLANLQDYSFKYLENRGILTWCQNH